MKHTSIFIVAALTLLFTGCMDNYDDPTNYVYGNPAIGDANITVSELKTKFAGVISSNGCQEITEDLVFTGIVVADDESGNVYKQIYVNDGTGTMLVGINASGLYAMVPVGQKVAIDCKGLYIGGYGSMAQLGSLYQGKIGRMPEELWKHHVRLIGQPSDQYEELEPMTVDEAWLNSASKADAPYFVHFENIKINEADGKAIYAPEDEADAGNGVNRSLKVGSKNLDFRNSIYANFASEVMPAAPVGMTGILSQYNGSWQFVVRTARDITE